MIYYIHTKSIYKNNAGEKAPEDICRICKSKGYTEYNVKLYSPVHGNIFELAYGFSHYLRAWIRLLFRVKAGDIILFQHPVHGAPVLNLMANAFRRKGCHLIFLIHDLESLRRGINGQYKESRGKFGDEVLLRKADVIICHNEYMRQYLLDRSFPENRVISLELFDYLYEDNNHPIHDRHEPLIIAGNLKAEKSSYIYDFIEKNPFIFLNLYGSNYKKDNSYSDNIQYKGVFEADELPGVLTGSYGIVWDGKSSDTCMGNTGEYLRYNNPHKLSLYIAAGLPVIVWNEAAVADFVEKNKIGLRVDSLNNLDTILCKISENEYSQMRRNVERLSKLVKKGHYFSKALDQALEICVVEAEHRHSKGKKADIIK